MKIREQAQTDVAAVFLPGTRRPEAWLWTLRRQRSDKISPQPGGGGNQHAERRPGLDATFYTASASVAEIAKFNAYELADSLD